MLHLLGLDHEKLTYKFQGRDFRLTDVHGKRRDEAAGVTGPAAESSHQATFLSGVIEGFYGQPWSRAERVELFEWMAAWGLNTYLYAPKDDLHHRALWREPYPGGGRSVRALIQACARARHPVRLRLSPGLDIRYGTRRSSEPLLRGSSR